MGQNLVPAVNIPIPTLKNGWCTYPKMVPLVDPQTYGKLLMCAVREAWGEARAGIGAGAGGADDSARRQAVSIPLSPRVNFWCKLVDGFLTRQKTGFPPQEMLFGSMLQC